MKIKILSSYPKKSFEINNLYFSSDLHLNHEAILKFGRNFGSIEEMNTYFIDLINSKVGLDDMIVLLGDSIMVNKDYSWLLNSIDCKNIIMLYGNHCNINKINNEFINNKLLYTGYYLELVVESQIICCSHYPMFNWNYQDEGSFHLHGHLHGDDNEVIKKIHNYKSLDVGVDNHYNLFGTYDIFDLKVIKNILNKKLEIDRH